MATLLQEAIWEKEHIREEATKELTNRRNEIYEKIPRIKEIDKEMARISIKLISSISLGKDKIPNVINQLKIQKDSLVSEKTSLLKANNYTPDYLEMRYHCKNCMDSGYIGNNMCNCMKRLLIKYAYRQSNLDSKYKNINLKNFNYSKYTTARNKNGFSQREHMQKIVGYINEYVEMFDFHNENLLLIGRPDIGKTYLCNAIGNELLLEGNIVIYYDIVNMLEDIRLIRYADSDFKKYESLYNRLISCDMLIIDNLSKENISHYTESTLCDLINKRVNNNKKTIITTDKQIKELLKTYDERITSRLFGSFTCYELL